MGNDGYKRIAFVGHIGNAVSVAAAFAYGLVLAVKNFHLCATDGIGAAQVADDDHEFTVATFFGNQTQVGGNDVALYKMVGIVVFLCTGVIPIVVFVVFIIAFVTIIMVHDTLEGLVLILACAGERVSTQRGISIGFGHTTYRGVFGTETNAHLINGLFIGFDQLTQVNGVARPTARFGIGAQGLQVNFFLQYNSANFVQIVFAVQVVVL